MQFQSREEQCHRLLRHSTATHPRDLRLQGGGLSLPQTRTAHSSHALPPSNNFCFQAFCHCLPSNSFHFS